MAMAMSITFIGRCLLCGETLAIRREDTGSLIAHLRLKHPGVSLAQLPCEREPSSLGESQLCHPSMKTRRHLYKTTVETWRPGPSKITCPSCGRTDQPLLRRQRTRVSSSQMAAMCLICSPLCLLLFPKKPTVELHCCHCNFYLGTYDSSKRRITPNHLRGNSSTIGDNGSAAN